MKHAKPQTFTIHLRVFAAVKSTDTLINYTKSSKSNVKPLTEEKTFFKKKRFKKKKKKKKYLVPEMHVLCACHTVGYSHLQDKKEKAD